MLIMCTNFNNKKPLTMKQQGFTLIEMMIVVVILGIVTTLSIPAYKNWIENTKILTAAQSIQNGLQKARVEALKYNLPVQFVLNSDTSWTVGCVTATATCPALIDSRKNKEGSSTSISLVITPSTSNTVVFSNLGLVSAIPVAFTQVQIDSTTLAAADSRELRVTLSAGGASKICDPFSGLPASDPRNCAYLP